jgi:hypothetical protein
MHGMTDPFAPWPLPDTSNWSFAQFRTHNPAEADALEATSGRDELLKAVTDELTLALSGTVVFAWEFAEIRNTDHRPVVQFPVSRTVFDWFFNGRSGYRAHYRAHSRAGQVFNAMLVKALTGVLERHVPATLTVPRVDILMRSHGDATISRTDFLQRFEPRLSKLWWGVQPVDALHRHHSVTGPKLLLGGTEWPSLYMDDPWLDLKGAFSKGGQLYQTKCPDERAEKLHDAGVA